MDAGSTKALTEKGTGVWGKAGNGRRASMKYMESYKLTGQLKIFGGIIKHM